MPHHTALRIRLLANALTLFLAAFGAWGWITDPQILLIEKLAYAGIALIAQQLANAAAICAGVAVANNKPASLASAVLLVIVFAGISGHAIEHALERPAVLHEAALITERAEARQRLDGEIQAATRERLTAESALRSIPTDIPTRRIQALQAPLNAAITRGEARVAELEAERAALAAPIVLEASTKAAALSILFWLLAFAEPGFYWLLASLRDGLGVPTVPNACPSHADVSVGTPSQPNRGLSRNLVGRLAVAVGLTAAPAAYAASARDAMSHVASASDSNGTDQGGTSKPLAVVAAERVSAPDAALVAAVRELDGRGLSTRRIAATLGVCSKSTVHRILQRARRR